MHGSARTSLLTLLVAAAIAPASVVAAPYKCVVDGKTTYQGQPCTEDVKARGNASTVAPPAPPGVRPGVVISKVDAERRDATAKRELEHIARDAFAAVKESRILAYTNLLCPKQRAGMATKLFAVQFKHDSQEYTENNAELGAATGVDANMVTFAATYAPPSGRASGTRRRVIRVQFDWVDDKPCVSGIF